ncbi:MULTISPECIES: hypothetical protein [unclassified Coleofasciculus]|uniref:hypothetical protein n=1 Tax=unclassified Coleofasciculus TaxID=2692782 RepID=UPI00187DFD9E|nr:MULTISPECIES: hypothetical protein [unclassified Coleofasciculus]MBE9126106.1 hypothetical protein [Coleofasciculus sp. LEGE 07081]MBE9147539.1 hypothetical protein [Coleofasciculus sp. LEGE 07092]
MIFVIPIILGVAAIATAAFGVVKGAEGVSDMQAAEKIGKSAHERHECVVSQLKAEWKATQKLAEEYGQLQLDVKMHTIGRFVAFIERIGQRGSQSDKRFLEEFEGVSILQIEEYKAAALEAERFVKGGFNALGAAAATSQGTVGLIGLFGTASTGTAISGLSGAAAWNATLAWLGGGSLAAGGGGMALGTIVLGGITVGPALAIGGFVLASQGEQALTKAREYEAKANKEITKINEAKDFLQQVRRRITELSNLVENLNHNAVLGLNELESQPFDCKRDARKFQQVGLLAKALTEIMKNPVLDSEGNLNSITDNIKEKYSYLQGI